MTNLTQDPLAQTLPAVPPLAPITDIAAYIATLGGECEKGGLIVGTGNAAGKGLGSAGHRSSTFSARG